MVEFNDFFDFTCFAIKELDKHPSDEKICFKCPLCGKVAYGFKNSCNGHRAAGCENCDISFRE